MYENWVVDELGYEVIRVEDLTVEELNELLDSHPEYTTRCIRVD